MADLYLSFAIVIYTIIESNVIQDYFNKNSDTYKTIYIIQLYISRIPMTFCALQNSWKIIHCDTFHKWDLLLCAIVVPSITSKANELGFPAILNLFIKGCVCPVFFLRHSTASEKLVSKENSSKWHGKI